MSLGEVMPAATAALTAWVLSPRLAALVRLGGQRLQLRDAAPGGLAVQLLEERDAPAATGAGPAALRQLARHPRPGQPDEVDQLAPGHVKAVTNLVVEVHRPSVG